MAEGRGRGIAATRVGKVLSAAAVLALTACWVTWKKKELISAVAWSDDDQRIALVMLRYEEKSSANPLNGTTDKRNTRHQLYVQNVDGSRRTAVTGEIAGQNATELYFMREAGYFVLGAVSDTERRFDRVGLDGAVTPIASKLSASCEARFFDVVPSPDGEVIAVVQAAPGCTGTGYDGPVPPSGGSATPTTALQVKLLDARSLAVLRTHTVTVSGWSIAWTWRMEGDFVVSDGSAAWSLDTDRNAVATALPRCAWPKTSSSEWSSQGVQIYADGDVVRTGVTDRAAAFGCQ